MSSRPHFVAAPHHILAGCVIALLAVVLIIALAAFSGGPASAKTLSRARYTTGYQIAPHFLGTSTWEGAPYVLTSCGSGAAPPQSRDAFAAAPARGSLVYDPPFTRVAGGLRGSFPNWWKPLSADGSNTYGLPPAAARPDFWAGDATLHTYLARSPIEAVRPCSAERGAQTRPPRAEQDARWRAYGGPLGWTMSPYY